MTITKKAEISAVINLDMIGHLQDNLIIQGVSSSQDWPHLLVKVAKKLDQKILMQSDPFLPTDSTSFYIRGIP